MLYLGIDQHAKQLTIDLSDENGDLLLHRQVKTKHSSLVEFLSDIRNQAEPEGGYMAIVEVCGFNNYLLNLLTEYGCDHVILVQPEERKKRKTDRRDARVTRITVDEPKTISGGEATSQSACREAGQRGGRDGSSIDSLTGAIDQTPNRCNQ